jgi:hypothetical protein
MSVKTPVRLPVLAQRLLEVVEEPSRDRGGLVAHEDLDNRDPRGHVDRGEGPDAPNFRKAIPHSERRMPVSSSKT